eukprot:629277-Amorphochlora_amoeboformis.AAC.1
MNRASFQHRSSSKVSTSVYDFDEFWEFMMYDIKWRFYKMSTGAVTMHSDGFLSSFVSGFHLVCCYKYI